MKIAIIGAGPAGLTAAYILSKNNVKVDVYEATPKVGGLCASFTLWEQTVDIGPHRFFSNDRKVNDLWLEVVGKEYSMVNRLTRIYYKERFFLYPIKLINALRNLGFYEAFNCLTSYFKELAKPVKQDGSFETWVQGRFGKRLYEIFFKTYSEKLWGISCTELDSDFASQRIKKLTLFEAVKNSLFEGKGNKHQTLVDKFAYPHHGCGSVYEKMAIKISESGSSIFLNTPIKQIHTHKGNVTGIEFFDGSSQNYDHVISSMPYTVMVKHLTEASPHIKGLASKLQYRNTIIVYLLIDSMSIFPDNWIYVHSSEQRMGRITNFRNWSSSLYGNKKTTILALEYWCNKDDLFWKDSDKTILSLASSDIVGTNLVKSEYIKKGHVLRIDKSYPLYNKGYKEILLPIVKFTQSINGLSIIGRNGSFKYNNQDHSILMGLFAAENILYNKNHNLNNINSDYDSYQESCTITETGLMENKKNRRINNG